MALADYQSLVDSLVRDEEGKISASQRDQAILTAVSRYSKDRPYNKIEDVIATSNAVPLPSGWQADFSRVLHLEYPLNQFPPSVLEAVDWQEYHAPSGHQIITRSDYAGHSIRVSYSVLHTLMLSSDSVPVADREPVASYAAAHLCDQLAALYSGEGDSTLQADTVDHGDKGRKFASRATALRKRFFDELGINPKRTQAAGAVVDLDLKNSLGRDRLMHPRRFR